MCSAGVGRSGTYITIDMLLDYLKSEEVQEINIRQIVSGLRMKRMEMVQSVVGLSCDISICTCCPLMWCIGISRSTSSFMKPCWKHSTLRSLKSRLHSFAKSFPDYNLSSQLAGRLMKNSRLVCCCFGFC